MKSDGFTLIIEIIVKDCSGLGFEFAVNAPLSFYLENRVDQIEA